jgi:hypothetical protein
MASRRTPNDAAPGDEPENSLTARPVSAAYRSVMHATASPAAALRRASTATVPPLPPPVIFAP